MSRPTANAERHVNDLLNVLHELLNVPELLGFEPEGLFDHTLEVMAKARVIRAAIIDERTERETGVSGWTHEPPR